LRYDGAIRATFFPGEEHAALMPAWAAGTTASACKMRDL